MNSKCCPKVDVNRSVFHNYDANHIKHCLGILVQGVPHNDCFRATMKKKLTTCKPDYFSWDLKLKTIYTI